MKISGSGSETGLSGVRPLVDPGSIARNFCVASCLSPEVYVLRLFTVHGCTAASSIRGILTEVHNFTTSLIQVRRETSDGGPISGSHCDGKDNPQSLRHSGAPLEPREHRASRHRGPNHKLQASLKARGQRTTDGSHQQRKRKKPRGGQEDEEVRYSQRPRHGDKDTMMKRDTHEG